MVYKDRAWCSNSAFCTEDCDRRLTEQDRGIVIKEKYLVSFMDFAGQEDCTHEKYNEVISKKVNDNE